MKEPKPPSQSNGSAQKLSEELKGSLDHKIKKSLGWIRLVGGASIIYGFIHGVLVLFLIPLLGQMFSSPALRWINLLIFFAISGAAVYLGVLLIQSAGNAKKYLYWNSAEFLVKYYAKLSASLSVFGFLLITAILQTIVRIITFPG